MKTTTSESRCASPPTSDEALASLRARIDRRRSPLRRTAGTYLPVFVSLCVHAALLAASAMIVWHSVGYTGDFRPVHISFDAPGQSDAVADNPSDDADGADERTSSQSTRSPRPDRTVDQQYADTAGETPTIPERPNLRGLLAAGQTGETDSSRRGDGPSAAVLRAAPVAAHANGQTPVRFAGLGTSNVESVIYVVDTSGPMVSSLPFVIAELERSVSRLSPAQRFNVVAFRSIDALGNDAGYERFVPRLVHATPEAKRRLSQWLADLRPGGRSNPLDGLRAAIAMQPQAVFLLSRSIERSGGAVWQHGLEQTLDELDRLNPRSRRTGQRPIAIKTIQFLDEDPTGILQAIAEHHGGPGEDPSYTVVRPGDRLGAP